MRVKMVVVLLGLATGVFGGEKFRLPVGPLPVKPILGDVVCSNGKVMAWNGVAWSELRLCDTQGYIIKEKLARPDVFAPVPKEGCPSGYYEVGHTFHDGLNWHSACWSKKLRRITPEEKVEVKISYDTTPEMQSVLQEKIN